MAYKSQANGITERMLQTWTRALKKYVRDVDSKDWDEYTEWFMFALNIFQDRILEDTPFYLIYGWDPRSTLEATLSLGNSKRRDVEPRRWWYHTQSQYKRARAAVNNRLKTAIQNWAERRNADP